MNQYKKLTVNTAILMLGTLGSRLIAFFMLPFYTNILSTTQYGTIDLLLQITNLLVPVCTFGVTAGIVRFGLDSHYGKKDVFTTGLISFGAGLTVCAAVAVAAGGMNLPNGIERYTPWILTLVAASSLHSVFGSFARARERVRTFAVTGIINTVSNVLLMVVFLKKMQMGIEGYLLAVITADMLSILFLTFSSTLWRFIGFESSGGATAREMLKYSIPTIPAAISWWIIEMSDRLMITAFISSSANGIYSVAAKIPSIVTIIAGVFINAWQISIISTKGRHERSQFYSNVMQSYQAVLFVMAGCVTMFARLIITLLTSPTFYEASEYIPLLISATTFSCLATFVGNIYTLEKRSVAQLITTLTAAAANITLNWLLIPIFGTYGAVAATFFSFMLLFFIRVFDTRKYIPLRWSSVRFIVSFTLLMTQNLIIMTGLKWAYIIQALCLTGITAVNFRPLLIGVRKVLSSRKRET